MTEEVLTHDERMFLECLAQSVASFSMAPETRSNQGTTLIINRARNFYQAFIELGD